MRGSSKFTTMKGFMDDYVSKGGESPETLPNESGSDVTDGEKLQDKANGGEPKKGKRVTNAPDITFDDELSMVEEDAKKDIADGYVADIQDHSKGYKAFNEMVQKGLTVEVELNQASDFKTIMKGIQDMGESMADLTLKETAEEMYAKRNSMKGQSGLTKSGKANLNAYRERSKARKEARYRSSTPSGGTVETDTSAMPKPKAEKKPSVTAGPGTSETLVKPTKVAEGPKPNIDATLPKDTRKLLWENKLKPGLKTAGKIGAAVGGVGLAAYGGKKLYDKYTKEDKCSGAPMRKKGFESEDDDLG